MPFVESVNASLPQDTVCMGVLAKYQTQYLVLDRCAGFLFEQFECFEFVSQLNSLSILETFDSFTAARATFELIHEREPNLVTLTAKPFEFDCLKTVEIRDHCEAYHG